MPEMPRDWRLAVLNELGTVERGRSRHRPRNDPALYGGKYPFVQTGDIKAAGLRLYQHTQTYNETGLAQSRLWPRGTLCITIAANICDTAILGIPACFPDSVVGFTASAEVADIVFVKYALDYAKHRFTGISRGATQDNLSVEKMLSQRLPMPPLPEQRRIASILEAYDDLIEVNRRRIALLEEVARRLFEEWFVRFRFPTNEGQVMVTTPSGPLPEGWRSGALGDVVEQRRDKASPGEHLSGRVYVPIECIGRKTLALSETRPWQEAQSSLQLFERDDILFGAMRAYFHKVCPAPMPGITRSTCFVLRPRSPSLFAFSTLALFRDETVAFAAANSTGSTIPYASWTGSLERFPIVIPPVELLDRFDGLVRPMLAAIMTLCKTNALLAVSRDLLLPRLISGEFSVAAAERELEAVT